MMSLSRRLARLEAGIAVNPAVPGFTLFPEQFAAIERRMLPLLSIEDRELWLRPVNERPQPGDCVWERWNEAFGRAAVEARQPFVISIADRWGTW